MLRPAVAAVAVLATLAVLAACGTKPEAPGRSATGSPSPADAATAAVTPPTPTPAAPPAPATPPPAARATLSIQLRSTPPGADAAVDGRPVGRTPTVATIDDNGKEHEFTFLLPGHALERYRTRPLKSGVIHARMRAIPTDAGP